MSVTVNVDKSVVTTNRTALGSQLEYYDWQKWLGSNGVAHQKIAKDANLKIMRIMVYRQTGMTGTPDKGPCVSWDATAHTGIFVWTDLDNLVNNLIANGIEPLLVLFHAYTPWSRLPNGFPTESIVKVGTATTVIVPKVGEDTRAYAKYFSDHYKGKVKYYETVNEIYQCDLVSWAPNTQGLEWTGRIHKSMYDGLKSGDPNCKISIDVSKHNTTWNYFIANNIPFDTVNFHTYAGNTDNPQPTNHRTILDVSCRYAYFGSTTHKSIISARTEYKAKYGIDPEVILSETNWNSCWKLGADPRNIQMYGTVCDAMSIIWSMYMGLTYRVHYSYGGQPVINKSYTINGVTTVIPESFGFGIYNSIATTPYPYYPQLLYSLVGPNLSIGDTLYATSPGYGLTPNDVFSVAWKHLNTNYVLIVNKADVIKTVTLTGLNGKLTHKKLTTAVDYHNPSIQTGNEVTVGTPFTVEAMSVHLLEQSATDIIKLGWIGFAKNPMDTLESWDAALTKGAKWKFNTIRLVVRFSTINYAQLDAVLAKIKAAGCQAIIDNHLLSQWVNADPKFGSQAMRDKWVEIVNRYKNNTTIGAWEIANEPFPSVWDMVNVKIESDVPKEYAIITDLIRAIDPIRPIVVMIPHKVDPGVSLRPGWIASFHPYTYGNLMTQAEAQSILTYRKSQIDSTMKFGYVAGWIGEIECHPSGTTPLDIEMWYVSQVLRYGYDNGYGYNYWKYYLPVDDAGANPDEVIFNAGFVPIITNPCQKYIDQLAQLQSDYDALQSKYKSLQSQYDVLQIQYNTLQEQYNALQSLNNALVIENTSLKQQIVLLQQQTIVLQNQLDEANTKIHNAQLALE